MAVLARLDDFRGESRFTTWAYKFALLEAAVKLRGRAWQRRELPLDPESWTLVPSGDPGPAEKAEKGALLAAITRGIETVLTPQQRTRARRARARRRTDRRPRRAARDDPRRALQVRARRPGKLRAHLTRRGWNLERGPDAPGRDARRLLGPGEAELGCDACFAELDRYVELELAGEDAGRLVPGMRPTSRLPRLPGGVREPERAARIGATRGLTEQTSYLIVGGGMTADAACNGIREHDPEGRIMLVGAEAHPPYKRPPLSKELWSGGDESTVARATEELGVDLRLGRRSSGSTSTRGRRSTPPATRTAGSGCCSRPAAGRVASAATTARSSTSGRSTTTGGSARRPSRARAQS